MAKSAVKSIRSSNLDIDALHEEVGGGGKKTPPPTEVFAIEAPNMRVIEIAIKGTAALMINRFSSKMKDKMLADHVAGSAAKQKGRAKPAKDIQELFNNARYVCTPPGGKSWDGISCGALRNALVRTCSIVGFKMTSAKQSLFILADGEDDLEKSPLIRIISDPPKVDERIVRNANGQPDVRIRPRYDSWKMNVRVRYDADVFTARDVVNLMMRVGIQNGLGEGRPFSKSGTGIDLGTFEIMNEASIGDSSPTVVAMTPKRGRPSTK